jgi:hypothetical protein
VIRKNLIPDPDPEVNKHGILETDPQHWLEGTVDEVTEPNVVACTGTVLINMFYDRRGRWQQALIQSMIVARGQAIIRILLLNHICSNY